MSWPPSKSLVEVGTSVAKESQVQGPTVEGSNFG
jgi:hypothetical protein